MCEYTLITMQAAWITFSKLTQKLTSSKLTQKLDNTELNSLSMAFMPLINKRRYSRMKAQVTSCSSLVLEDSTNSQFNLEPPENKNDPGVCRLFWTLKDPKADVKAAAKRSWSPPNALHIDIKIQSNEYIKFVAKCFEPFMGEVMAQYGDSSVVLPISVLSFMRPSHNSRNFQLAMEKAETAKVISKEALTIEAWYFWLQHYLKMKIESSKNGTLIKGFGVLSTVEGDKVYIYGEAQETWLLLKSNNQFMLRVLTNEMTKVFGK